MEENRFPASTIDILIPTRERPESLEATIRSLHDTATEPDKITVATFVDVDDKPSGDKINEIAEWAKDKLREIVLCVAKPQLLSDAYNAMSEWTDGEVLMYAADDLVFETQGWDVAVKAAFKKYKDRVVLVSCHDPARPDKNQFPDHGFISRWATNTLKYVFPTFPPHPDIENAKGMAFTDIWLNSIYTQLGRTEALPDVVIRHKHWHPRHDGASHDQPLDDNYVRHAILHTFRKTPEYARRLQELPLHAATLQKFIDWVAGGGLEREVVRNLRVDAMYAAEETEPSVADAGQAPSNGDTATDSS